MSEKLFGNAAEPTASSPVDYPPIKNTGASIEFLQAVLDELENLSPEFKRRIASNTEIRIGRTTSEILGEDGVSPRILSEGDLRFCSQQTPFLCCIDDKGKISICLAEYYYDDGLTVPASVNLSAKTPWDFTEADIERFMNNCSELYDAPQVARGHWKSSMPLLKDQIQHEIGHALACCDQITKDPSFIAAYKADVGALGAEEKNYLYFLDPEKGIDEAFAEGYSLVLDGKCVAKDFSTHFPHTCEWIRQYMQGIDHYKLPEGPHLSPYDRGIDTTHIAFFGGMDPFGLGVQAPTLGFMLLAGTAAMIVLQQRYGIIGTPRQAALGLLFGAARKIAKRSRHPRKPAPKPYKPEPRKRKTRIFKSDKTL